MLERPLRRMLIAAIQMLRLAAGALFVWMLWKAVSLGRYVVPALVQGQSQSSEIWIVSVAWVAVMLVIVWLVIWLGDHVAVQRVKLNVLLLRAGQVQK